MATRVAWPLTKFLTRPCTINCRVAFISGKASRPADHERYPPWPYQEKSYTNFHSLFVDNTRKRFDDNTKVIFVEGMPSIEKSAFAQELAEDLDMKYFPMATMDLMYINKFGYDIRQLDPQLPPAARSFDEKRFIREPSHRQNIFFQEQLLMIKMHLYFDCLAHVLNTGQGAVMERSPFSDFVFADAMFKVNYFTRKAYDAYNNYYHAFMKVLIKPHLVIYLDVPSNVVSENLKKRGLGEEKVYTPEFLEAMEEKYKFKFLKDIEQHAEVMVYDWTVPGDVEVVVEDIERIDFDRWETEADLHHPKMKDWRFENEEHANERRWMYTHQKQRLITGTFLKNVQFECDDEFINAEDYNAWVHAVDEIPGMEYDIGWSPAKGDNVWFKRPKNVWLGTLEKNFKWQ